MDGKKLLLVVLVIIIVVWIIQVLLNSNVVLLEDEISSSLSVSTNIKKSENRGELVEADRRLKHILMMAGFNNVKYQLKDHPTKSFTKNKEEMNICSSCVSSLMSDGGDGDGNNGGQINNNKIPFLDKLLYIGLHEVSHVINKNIGENNEDETKKGENNNGGHDEKWENIFKGLLKKACTLGYLDQRRLKF